MKERSVRPVKEFRYTDLFIDFLDKKPAIKKYFFRDTANETAIRIDNPRVDRGLMCDILKRQNIAFKAKPETFCTIEKLRHEDALCIFAGQQAGLFGGPLLTLYKAIGIVNQAKLLEQELHRPVVPIFWIAADDHDFEEIDVVFYLDKQGELTKLNYGVAPETRIPSAEILLDNEEAYHALADSARAAYGSTEFSENLLGRLFDAYSLNSNMVEAFGKFLLDTLPDMGLIVFSPADKEVKTISKGFFKRLAEGFFNLKELLEETERNLAADGYHIQAEKRESAVHLFFHAPERIAIHFKDDSFVVGEKTLGISGLLDLIEKNPEKFSPDVLTRPLWQSYLFPVVAQAGGPSEIAYFAQIGKLFEPFNLVQPYYYFRPALTIVEKRQEEFLEKFDLKLVDLTGDVEELINRVTARSFPKEIEAQIASFRARFEDAYNELFSSVRQFDETLEPLGKQTYGKIDFAINAFEKKIYDHHKRKMESTRNQIYRLSTALFPNRNLQERSLNINYYISKYGFGIVDFIVGSIEAGNDEHQMIYISEFEA